MAGNFKQLLADKKLLIADGATGSQLTERGLPPGCAPEQWNLEKPEVVGDIARAYVEAGADIISTNTFGGSGFKLAGAGLADKVELVNRCGVELSVKAAAGKALVFASVGPTGLFLEPVGDAKVADVTACFAEQIRAIVSAGADGVCIETMTDLAEACAALAAARANCDLPVVVSMTYDKVQTGYATMMGVKPDRAAADLQAAGADIVGANCGAGIEQIIEITRITSQATDLPIWAKPNAGLPELVDGKTVFRQGPAEMAGHFAELVAAGAVIIGGCCGTTPEHIRLLVAARDKLCAQSA